MNAPTEITIARILRILTQCRLACGAEAVARGFHPEAGYDIYEGCCADALQYRSEQEFLDWTYRLDEKYGCDSTDALNPLMELYHACSEIMQNYLRLLKKLDDANNHNSNDTITAVK